MANSKCTPGMRKHNLTQLETTLARLESDKLELRDSMGSAKSDKAFTFFLKHYNRVMGEISDVKAKLELYSGL